MDLKIALGRALRVAAAFLWILLHSYRLPSSPPRTAFLSFQEYCSFTTHGPPPHRCYSRLKRKRNIERARESKRCEYHNATEKERDRNHCGMATDGNIRWRDADPEGVMAYVQPRLARHRPFLMSGDWVHQVLSKGAAQRWKTFAGIKSVLAAHGLDELSECT